MRRLARSTPSLGGRVVAAIDRSNRLAPIGIRPPQVEETASHCHVTITAQGKELHGKLCSVSSSQNIVCSGHFFGQLAALALLLLESGKNVTLAA